MKKEVDKIKDAKFHCEEKINLAIKELIDEIGHCSVEIENNTCLMFGNGGSEYQKFNVRVRIL